MLSKYIQVIENGKLIMDNNIKCDRCHRTNGGSYMTYDKMDLCIPCVEIINIMLVGIKKNIKYPPSDILVRMEIDIYKNEFLPRDRIFEFKIIDKINDQFKVSINNKISLMDEETIIKNYWDYLSNYDRDYFLRR